MRQEIAKGMERKNQDKAIEMHEGKIWSMIR